MKKQTTQKARTSADIAVKRIVESPWNVHGKQDEDMDGLAESIKQQGVVQRLTVRPVYKGGDRVTDTYELVDGHRRFRAAKKLKLETVPCDIVELTDEEAQAATLAANVQRLDNDPLLEASLIERMRAQGRTYREIAAAIGRNEGHVCRRARLTTLAACWREEYAKAEDKPSIATLEKIAAYEPDLQEAAWKQLSNDGRNEVRFDSYYFGQAFTSRMRNLDDNIAFDAEKAGCAKCPFNTACHPDLFGDDEEYGETARCQNAECYVRNWNAAVDAKIEKLRKKGIEPAEYKKRYDIPQNWSATKGKTKTNTVPYVYETDGLKNLIWSVADQKAADPAKTEEEKALAKAEKLRKRLIRSARDKMRDAIAERLSQATFRETPDYARLARRIADREMASWISDRTLDDFAEIYEDAFDCLEENEANAYRQHIAAKGDDGETDEDNEMED